MKLTLSQIKEITLGAVRIEEAENQIHFYRFTKQQTALYKDRNEQSYMRSLATSGIQLRFCTNSRTLALTTVISRGSSRSYFAFDVFVSGVKLDTLDNFSNVEIPQNYSTLDLPFGEFSKEFDLGIGEKEVCIYFPWSAKATLKELILDDDAFIKPVKPSNKMLCFGDSITQGYDALYPSSKYITQFANALDAEEYNKAIGGEVFFPQLASTKEAFDPDYITVAYGTNDWHRCTKEAFTQNCKEFLYNLHENYPNARIFVITPIWHKDVNECKPFGKFESVATIIQDLAAKYDNMLVLPGYDFVPHDENLFGDLRLHPNDRGFAYYFENLSKGIKDLLPEL